MWITIVIDEFIAQFILITFIVQCIRMPIQTQTRFYCQKCLWIQKIFSSSENGWGQILQSIKILEFWKIELIKKRALQYQYESTMRQEP